MWSILRNTTSIHDEQFEQPRTSITMSEITTNPLDRIVHTDGVCGGSARIAGTRIPVWLIAQRINLGESVDDICRELGGVTKADILQCIDYACINGTEIRAEIFANESL